MNINFDFLTPALISTVVTAVLAPLLFYLLKQREEKRKRNFEVRFAEYKKYLHTLDEISQASRDEFADKFLQEVTGVFTNIITNPTDSANAILKLQDSLWQLLAKQSDIMSKCTAELHGLRLVCSDKLLKLVDEFVKLQMEMLEDSRLFINDWQNLVQQFQTNPTKLVDQNKWKGEKAEKLKEEILRQMRLELKIQ